MSPRRILAVALAGALASIVPAGAAHADSSCADNRVCMWEDSGFGGDRWVNDAISGTGSHNIPGWDGDNEISSIKNTTDFYLCVYADDYTWGGEFIIMRPNSQSDNLARDYGFDNDAESYKVTNSPTYDCN